MQDFHFLKKTLYHPYTIQMFVLSNGIRRINDICSGAFELLLVLLVESHSQTIAEISLSKLRERTGFSLTKIKGILVVLEKEGLVRRESLQKGLTQIYRLS